MVKLPALTSGGLGFQVRFLNFSLHDLEHVVFVTQFAQFSNGYAADLGSLGCCQD